MGETVVVIGINHAGTAAINTILGQFPEDRVIAFNGNSNISFLGCGMTLWIGEQISGPEGLFYSSRGAFEEKGVVIHVGTKVSRIDYDKKMVYGWEKGETIHEQPYDKLILATGSLPIRPELQGMDLENIRSVKLYQDARDVVQKLKDPSIRRVAVVGAGYIGMELAEAFMRNGRETVLVDCAGTCLAGYYDSEFSYIMGRSLESHGVELALGETIAKLEGRKRVQTVVTGQARYQADMVVFDIGFEPNMSLGQGKLELFRGGAYLVDRRQETSVAGVYVIGNYATVYSNAIRVMDYIALAANTVRSGIITVHSACGGTLESMGVQGLSGISIWELHMLCTGIGLKRAQKMEHVAASSDYRDWQKAGLMKNGNNKVKTRIVHDKGTRIILGAQVCSDYDTSMGIHLFSVVIEGQVTIDKLKLLDLFFLPRFNKPYNYITMTVLAAR